jgi:hypothetical protein
VDEFFVWSTLGDAPFPPCSDGVDNDDDGEIDFDGGASALGGVAGGPPDPACMGLPFWSETGLACGSGFELTLLLPALFWLRTRTRARTSGAA